MLGARVAALEAQCVLQCSGKPLALELCALCIMGIPPACCGCKGLGLVCAAVGDLAQIHMLWYDQRMPDCCSLTKVGMQGHDKIMLTS